MQAIVLAGGKGQRLWPLTKSIPKVMTIIAGKPVLRHHLEWLRNEGVTDVVVACGYLGEFIIKYLLSYPVLDLRVKFSSEEYPLGRGGAAKKATRNLPRPFQPCIISQGDIISDIPLAEAYRAHLQASSVCNTILTLLLVPYRSRYGVVEIRQDGTIARFREKPRLPTEESEVFAATFIVVQLTHLKTLKRQK